MSPAPTLYSQGHQLRESGDRAIRPLHGGILCLDFINTASDHTGPAGKDDLSPGYATIVDWFWQAGVLTEDDTTRLLRAASKEPRDAAAVRKRAVALREALYDLVVALTTGREVSAASLDLFNQEHGAALRHGHFAVNGTFLAWEWPGGSQLERVLWPVCESAADLLGGERLRKMKQCEAPGCQAFFLDGSKNDSRRFCSAAACGTADRVRRFRERHKPGADAATLPD